MRNELVSPSQPIQSIEHLHGRSMAPPVALASMADAWIQFARTGDPNHPGMPKWSAFSPDTVPTMIFDDNVRLALDPDKEEQASIGVV